MKQRLLNRKTEYNRETMVYTRQLTVSEAQLKNQRLFLYFEGVEGKGSALSLEDHERDMQLITETGATMIPQCHAARCGL